MTVVNISRRRFLTAAGAGGVSLAGGLAVARARRSSSELTGESTADTIGPNDPEVARTERRRGAAGAPIRALSVVATPGVLNMAGRRVPAWSYDGAVPGREVRVRAGDRLRVLLRNELPEATTIHWHGIALRNDMDGVPNLTQDAVASGGSFEYAFVVPDPGTYFFHPHTGPQLDRGLYAPLIVEDPREPGAYDAEATLVLDDWLDAGTTPDEVLENLRSGRSAMVGMDMDGIDMEGMDMASPGAPLGEDTGDVSYATYLVNGRPPTEPFVVNAKPGQRVRLRIVNAGSDTPFRFAIGDHRLTVSHTDGFPVEPVTVDALLIGMGERYDVVITAGRAGTFPIAAAAEAKGGRALAVLRTGSGRPPSPTSEPRELQGRLLSVEDLRATADVTLPNGVDRTHVIQLGGDMAAYRWSLGSDGTDGVALPVRMGERVRLLLENRTMMWHPLHVHGHTFQIRNAGEPGARKDTVIVPPMRRTVVDLLAENPGRWAVHCHNIYHAEAGMMTTLSYVR